MYNTKSLLEQIKQYMRLLGKFYFLWSSRNCRIRNQTAHDKCIMQTSLRMLSHIWQRGKKKDNFLLLVLDSTCFSVTEGLQHLPAKEVSVNSSN